MGDVQAATQIVLDRIRSYWSDRPEAADTARGIAQWWLADLKPQPPMACVLDALRRLEAEGSVQHRTNLDGTVVWRLRSDV